MDRWIQTGQVDGQIQTYRTGGQMDRHRRDRWMDRQIQTGQDGWTDGQTDTNRTGRQMDRYRQDGWTDTAYFRGLSALQCVCGDVFNDKCCLAMCPGPGAARLWEWRTQSAVTRPILRLGFPRCSPGQVRQQAVWSEGQRRVGERQPWTDSIPTGLASSCRLSSPCSRWRDRPSDRPAGPWGSYWH